MTSTNNLPGHNEETYGFWAQREGWKDKLQKKATHKALNIPEIDDMNITTTTNNTSSGVGALGLALASGIPTLGVAGLAAAMLTGLFDKAPQPATPNPAAVKDTIDVEVIFYDEDGNPRSVPHISERVQ